MSKIKVDEKKFAEDLNKFKDLVNKDIDDQLQLFLKSFIFDLGDNWKEVVKLNEFYRKRLREAGENKEDLNPVMAADFLQKHGLERTATERKNEVQDIDLDKNGRIAFIEYLLLHYKVMILNAYLKRTSQTSPWDLSKGGVGVANVGPFLLDELFTIPLGLDPELEKAIEEFTKKKRAREGKIRDLETKAAKGGVAGLAATNEIKQMESEDLTYMNKIELTLNAAKRRSGATSAEKALAEKKKKEEDEKKAKRDAGRSKLKAMSSQWEAGKSAAAVIADVSKPHDLKHQSTTVRDAGLQQAKLEGEIKKGTKLAHTTTAVHDSGLQQAKLDREIRGKHELHHVNAPKGGLSDAEKAAYLEEKKSGGKS